MENIARKSVASNELSLESALLDLFVSRPYLLAAHGSGVLELQRHAAPSTTCAEKGSLTGLDQHLVIKTVFFELRDKVYGVMCYGDLVLDSTQLFAKTLGISRNQAKRARLARCLPSGMQPGTCTPFLTPDNLQEVEHLFLASADTQDWVNVSLGGTASDSKMYSARIRYEDLLALVHSACGTRCSVVDLSGSAKQKPEASAGRSATAQLPAGATAHVLEGKAVASRLRARVARAADVFQQTFGRRPCLSVVVAGDDYASRMYVESERRACEKVGLEFRCLVLNVNANSEQVLDEVERLNDDPRVDGVQVQLPLPAQIDPERVREAIDPDKDVDGFHPYNLGLLSQARPRFRACTSRGVLRLLQDAGVAVSGMNAVVVGASSLVGRPMALELLNAGATVTICHKDTTNLREHVSHAELLVVAAGRAGLIPGDWIKAGAVVVDIGTNRAEGDQLVGDVDFVAASFRASLITPVPGGVGPTTVAQLLANTVQAALWRSHRAERLSAFERAQLELCGAILDGSSPVPLQGVAVVRSSS